MKSPRVATDDQTSASLTDLQLNLDLPEKNVLGIREQLQIWQGQHGLAITTPPHSFDKHGNRRGGLQNLMTRAGNEQVEEPDTIDSPENHLEALYDHGDRTPDLHDAEPFFKPGDMVELV